MKRTAFFSVLGTEKANHFPVTLETVL